MSPAPPSTPSSGLRQVEWRIQPIRDCSLLRLEPPAAVQAPLASLLFSAKPGLRPLWASAREPRVLAWSQGCSRAALTMAPFRAELARGTGVRVQTLRKGLWKMAALSTAQPDVGVATSQLGPPSLGWGGGPSRVSVGADRGKDYSWVLAHALAGICRLLAKNDVGLVFQAILAVTAGAWAPFSLGPEQEPEASCPGSASLPITAPRYSACSALTGSPWTSPQGPDCPSSPPPVSFPA